MQNKFYDINKIKPEKKYVFINTKYLTDFINEIDKVCKKYKISISHEDQHGSFILTDYDEYYTNWLRDSYYKKED